MFAYLKLLPRLLFKFRSFATGSVDDFVSVQSAAFSIESTLKLLHLATLYSPEVHDLTAIKRINSAFIFSLEKNYYLGSQQNNGNA